MVRELVANQSGGNAPAGSIPAPSAGLESEKQGAQLRWKRRRVERPAGFDSQALR